MNNIDFLPASYHEQRAQRNFKHRRTVLILLMVLALIGWGVTRHKQSAELAWKTKSLEAQVEAAQLKRSEFDKLREERKSLIYQESIQQQLDQPIAVTQAVAVIGRLLPDSIGLTNIKIVTHRPPPKPMIEPEENKKRNRSSNDRPVDPETLRDYLEVEVRGVAPDDIVVAELVNAMNDHPLFTRVAMHFSRTDERDGMVMRRFSIGAEVSLDRQYKPTVQSAGVSDED